MIKISLCICFYNSEEFIKRALDSFVEFLTDEIEVILVDDGSIDGSAEIVKQYLNDHRQIKLIRHEKNKGISRARITGVNKASGSHIMFLDADDYFIKKQVKKIFSLDFNEFDIVEFQAITSSGTIIKSNFLQKEPNIGIEYLNHFFKGNSIPHYLWLRIFKRNLFLSGALIDEYQLHEDTFALPILIANSKKILFLNEQVVYYDENTISIMSNIIKIQDFKSDSFNLDNYLKYKTSHAINKLKQLNHYERVLPHELKNLFYYRYLVRLFLSFSYNFKGSHQDRKTFISEYNIDFKKLRLAFKFSTFHSHLSFKQNILLFLFGTKFASYILILKSKLEVSKIQIMLKNGVK